MAKPTIRINLNISPEASGQLEELMKIMAATKTAVIEAVIKAAYAEKTK